MNTIQRLSLCALFALCSLYANAIDFYDFYKNGFYYKYVSKDDHTCETALKNYYETIYTGDVVIPETTTYSGVTYTVVGIGYMTFYYSKSSLKSVSIPKSVTYIGESAFNGCSALTEIIIPDSVTTIGKDAFRDCSKLTSVTLGNSVTEIGNYAFDHCSSLESIYSLNPEPPTCGTYTFYDVSKRSCTIYVPKGSQDAYSTAKEWRDFNIVEMDMTGIESVSVDDAEAIGYYTIDGKAVDVPQRGVNIVKFSDGTTKKVLVK